MTGLPKSASPVPLPCRCRYRTEFHRRYFSASGVAEPTQPDWLLTDVLKRALGLVDVRVLDHFVVAMGQTLSFAEKGLI